MRTAVRVRWGLVFAVLALLLLTAALVRMRQRIPAPTEYGGVPEWPKGTDCKSAGYAYGGSNPPAPTLH